MNSGYYAAYSALLARAQTLDVSGSNLANVNTHGYRAGREYFRSAIQDAQALGSQLNTAINRYGVLGGSRLDLAQGTLLETGNPLDLAIEGHGFFAIQTAQGIRYTRDGSFVRGADGSLQTADHAPVLDARSRPILIPAGEVHVGSDGVVSVAGAVAGKIAVMTFSGEAQMTAEGTNRYLAPPGGTAQVSTANIHQGSLEGSNQDAITGSLNLVLVQRQAEMMQKALSIFHSDFDKTASEELPRI